MTRACQVFDLPRSTLYRLRQPVILKASEQCQSHRGLTPAERTAVHELLNSQRFCDLAPRQVYGILLDEGKYYCSISTMYRILSEHDEVKERRRQRTRPHYVRPELLATGPNQVWSWDITWLKGPHTWQFFYLYVILDIFSRYVTGWMVAEQESGELAEQLIAESCHKQAIQREQLTLHADRGSPMKAKTTALLLADLGVGKSHSRPHVSNDNPFSESQFKTLKYNPQFPDRFGSPMDARVFCGPFFQWYNTEFRHSGIAMMTPEMVHYGLVEDVQAKRQGVLAMAYAAHPERFVRGKPTSPDLPNAVWINPPAARQGQIIKAVGCDGQQEAVA